MIFWNIRSVNSKNSFTRLMELNRSHIYSFIALLEPFQDPIEFEQYKGKLGINHALANFSSKIWIFWRILGRVN